MFTRHHVHVRSFRRLRLDERALRSVARILASAAARHDRLALKIQVKTADGQETFLTSDPEFFLSPDMPQHVGSVHMTSSGGSAPVEWDVQINGPYHPGVRIDVKGTDSTAVAGLFSELSRSFEAHLVGPNWLRFDRSGVPARFAVGPIAVLLSLLSVYPVVRLLFHFFPEWSSAIRPFSLTLGIVATTLGLTFLPDAAIRSIDRAFPLVEFGGSLHDTGKAARKRLVWWTSAVVLPLLLNVIAGLLVALLPSAPR